MSGTTGLDPGGTGSGGSGGGSSNASRNGDPAAGQGRCFLIFPTPSTPPPSGGSWRQSASSPRQCVWECYVNPDQLELVYPTRGQIVQTIGGAYVDSFGYGLPNGQLSGTFGWGRDRFGKTGLGRLADLKALYENWQEATVALPTDTELLFTFGKSGGIAPYNIYLTVYWQKLSISRSKSSPLLANYSLSFTVVQDHSAKNQKPVIPPIASATSGAAPTLTSGSGNTSAAQAAAESVASSIATAAAAAAAAAGAQSASGGRRRL